MTTFQPETPASEFPWHVVAMHDCENPADGFAYTDGLHATYGHPELLIHRDPERGDDPDQPFRLSTRDLHSRLMRWGVRVRDGERVGPGYEETALLDGGLTTVVYRFGAELDTETAGACCADPQARVVPVLWDVRRPPPPEPEPADEETAAWVASETADLAARLGVAPRAELRADVEARYGIWTAAIQVLFVGLQRAAGRDLITATICGHVATQSPHRLNQALGVAEGLAYRHGRHRMLRALREDCAIEIGRLWLARGAELTRRWGDGEEAEREVGAYLARALEAYATGILLRDLIDDDVQHQLSAPLALSLVPLDTTRADIPVSCRPLVLHLVYDLTLPQMRRIARAHRPHRERLEIHEIDAELWLTERGSPPFWEVVPVPQAAAELGEDYDDFRDAVLCAVFAAAAAELFTDDERRELLGGWADESLSIRVPAE